MSRAVKIAIVAWIVALLAAPLVAFALGARPASIENRTPAAPPAFSLSTLLHLDAWKQAATAFADRLPWRDTIIHRRGAIEFHWLGDSPSPNAVIVGSGGWLFLHEEFETCLQQPDVTPQAVAWSFDLVHAVVEATGRRLRYVIVPAKATIETNHYRQPGFSFERCSREHEQQVHALVRRQRGFIDLYPAMLAAKAHGQDLWMPTDSHLDGRGSRLLAHAIVTSLDPSRWEPSLERLSAAMPFAGDLSNLMGYPTAAPIHAVVAPRPPRRPFTDRVLALGDSQLDEAGSAIFPYFPNSTSYRFEKLIDGEIAPRTVREARIILLESVVRYTYKRVGGFPQQLVDPLVDELPLRRGRWVAVPGTRFDARGRLRLDVPDVALTVQPGTPDDTSRWRVLRLGVTQANATDTGAATIIDPNGALLPNPLAGRAIVGKRQVLALAIPPDYPLAKLRIHVQDPVGARLEPPAIATLGT